MKFQEKGVTLIEILVAMGIFWSIIIGILAVISYTMLNMVTSENATIAVSLCREEIEAIKNIDYVNIPCPGTFTPSPYPTGNFPPILYSGNCDTPSTCTLTSQEHDHKDLIVKIGKNNGTKTITVAWIDDPSNGTGVPNNEDYKRITVTINWNEGRLARERSIFADVCDK